MLQLYTNIKNKRLELGLSQDELAQKTGYTSRSSIAKIESGKVDLPQTKIKLFAEALETTPGDLMGWDDDSSETKEPLAVKNILPIPKTKSSPLNRIKELRKKFGIKQIDLCKQLDIAQGTLSGWENNKYEPDLPSLTKMAEIFDVSIDYLLGVSDTQGGQSSITLTPKDERNIQKDLEKMMQDLESGEAGPTSYGGELNLSDNDKEILKATLEQALRIIKLKNKETYTPHKYRKNNDSE